MKLYACTNCQAQKQISEFWSPKKRGQKRGPCKICRAADIALRAKQRAEKAEKNKALRPAYRAKWRKENAESMRAYQAAWFQKNKVRLREKSRLAQAKFRAKQKTEGWMPWHKREPAKALALCRRRQAGLKTASVKWATQFFMNEAYDLARRRSNATGFAWHVDHIVPLKHPLVCGLHCEQNLAVIPGVDNVRKSNAAWPEMP